MKIEVSKNFKDVINSMSDTMGGKVRELLNRNDVKDFRFNYIDLYSDSDSLVSVIDVVNDKPQYFLVTNSIDKFFNPNHKNKDSINVVVDRFDFDLTNYNFPDDIGESGMDIIIKGEESFNLRNSTLSVTFCKYESLDKTKRGITLLKNVDVRDLYNKKSRVVLKIGKLFKNLLENNNIEVSDVEVENFTIEFKRLIGIKNNVFSTFEVVSGEDIVKWYSSNNYNSISGTLGSSCMRNSSGRYFDIYSRNKNVEMVILHPRNSDNITINKNKIEGRALLWNIGDYKILDRIYTNDSSKEVLFREYAKRNGWGYKNISTNGNEFEYTIGSEVYHTRNKPITVKIENWDFSYYPYIDSLKYIDVEKSLLTTNKPSGKYLYANSAGGSASRSW